jgi:hypothetical protein
MTHPSKELEQVRQARASLQKVRMKLLRPSVVSMESSADDLVVALEYLKRLEPMLGSRHRSGVGAEQALRLEIAGLRRELQQVNELMNGAGKFYEGWARLMSTADECTANYTGEGKPGGRDSRESGSLVIHG